MLFTCVVGIIELLPEFYKIKGIFGFTPVSELYFAFLVGNHMVCYRQLGSNNFHFSYVPDNPTLPILHP